MAPRADTRAGADTRLFREIILEHLHRRFEKTRSELEQDVIADYGSFCIRRFHRQLQYLIKVGCISRNCDNFDLDTGAMTPTYRLITRSLPEGSQAFCRICGMIGAWTATHPLHLRRVRQGGEIRYRQIEIAPVRTRAHARSGAGSIGSYLSTGLSSK